MSDEIDEAPAEDTPTVETAATPEVNWEKRYQDLQPEYTRTTQALKRFETDPDAVIEFLQQHHPDLLAEDEEDDEEPDDDTPQFLSRAEFEQFRTNEAAKEANRQYETDLKRFVGDRELSDYGRKALDYDVSQGKIKTPEDLKTAVEGWFAYEDQRAPAEEPKKKKAPHVLPGGEANTGVKPFHEMTRKEREQWQLERLQGLSTQT